MNAAAPAPEDRDDELEARRDGRLHARAPFVTDAELAYLEQLFCKLRRSGLVESVRGPGGGYTLGRAPERLAVADIMLAVDEPIDATQCRGRENCHDDRRCMTHGLWAGLNDCILAYLQSVTLAELVRQQQPREGEVAVLHDQRHAGSGERAPEPARMA